jgi:hypothetical protein
VTLNTVTVLFYLGTLLSILRLVTVNKSLSPSHAPSRTTQSIFKDAQSPIAIYTVSRSIYVKEHKKNALH